MTGIYSIETPRLLLRQWQAEDYDEFARMNADPDVMRYFPSLLTREQSDELTDKFRNLIAQRGWGFWVTVRKSDAAFIGLVGLNLADDLPVPPCVEVGWRLDIPYWGNGYATESAAAALHFAFTVLEQESVAAFTTVMNSRSRKVMARLGMRDREENFLHPRVPEDCELREHVFYEIERERFAANFQADSIRIMKR